MAEVSDFIQDGHKAHIRWDADSIYVTHIECPHQGKVGMCNRLRDFCVVNRFIGVYGPECNVGSVSVTGPVEVAWYPVPGRSDLDDEFKHVWIVPVEDPDFVAAKFVQGEPLPIEPPEDD